jgi:hypothetical protein
MIYNAARSVFSVGNELQRGVDPMLRRPEKWLR